MLNVEKGRFKAQQIGSTGRQAFEECDKVNLPKCPKNKIKSKSSDKFGELKEREIF